MKDQVNFRVNFYNTVEPFHNGHRIEVAVVERCMGSTTCGGVQHVYCAKFMLTVSHNANPIMFNIYIEIKFTKNLNNVLNQNVNETK